MRPIPKALIAHLGTLKRMKACCLCGETPVQWHHAIIYKGQQVNEEWAIVAACKPCHETRLKELELVALEQATDEELSSISKGKNYLQRREYLRGIYVARKA